MSLGLIMLGWKPGDDAYRFELRAPFHGTRLPPMPVNTVEDLQTVLNAIEYRGALGLMQARVAVERDGGTAFIAMAGIMVPHRDCLPNTLPIPVMHEVIFGKPIYASTVLQQVRDAFARLLLHEIAEGI